MKLKECEINWLGHSSILIKNSKIIYIDPYKIADNLPKADFILLTHSHYDHCSYEDIKKIIQQGTKVICTADCQSSVTRFTFPVDIKIIEPLQELSFGEIKILGVPAYNLEKSFHTRDENWVGYLIKYHNAVIYHAGDTDFIPEMQKITGYKQQGVDFVAFLPIGGRFTMDAEEAVKAAKMLKPTVVVPIHYGTVEGTLDDTKYFKELCEEAGVNVEIMEKS